MCALDDARDMPGSCMLTVDALLDNVRRELQFAQSDEVACNVRKDLVVDSIVVDFKDVLNEVVSVRVFN